jgi:phasin family protein
MNAQVNKFFAPVRELNALAVENVEKVIGIQMKYIEDSAKLGIESLKGAAAIDDVEGLRTYLTKQAEVSKELSERALNDSKTVMELGKSYTNEVQKIMKDALATANS